MVLDVSEPAVTAPAMAPADVCCDRSELEGLAPPPSVADSAIVKATSPTSVVSALKGRIRAATGVIRELERYETASS